MSKNILLATNDVDCRNNFQFITRLYNYFEANGYVMVDDLNDVEWVVIAGCGFHTAQYEKVQNTIKHLNDLNIPDEKIMILGCLPKTHQDELESFFHGCIVPYKDTANIDNILNSKVKYEDIPQPNELEYKKNIDRKDKMFYIKLSEGCVGACSYCIIRKAKGPLVSVDEDDVLNQYQHAVEKDYKKVFLFGEDSFAYGVDKKQNIFNLMNKMLDINSEMEFFFGQVDPRWLIRYENEFIELFKNVVIKRFDVGLQHNNERILKLMRRESKFEDVYRILKILKSIRPNLYISTDIIIGFPSETEEEFQGLVDFLVNDTILDSIGVSGYSDHKNAASYYFEGKLSANVIASRWYRLNKQLGSKSVFRNSDEKDYNKNNSFINVFGNDIVNVNDIIN